ncbi:hypothetical protein K3181_08280 [Qipengyuania sp. YG27]|uniref:DUF4175 domain-containing protein n=1 Tax=Qipengyuania mesophila TaxID=2867246 RepID=A0ABS7JUU6_9SPHN|nr:hypothetical protein [Qipengyuania mesophila]MBX7501436.1 hypothetical protein [Qipengyuania mesophila]
MTDPNDGAWFAPKRFGYGCGLPIARQGWALLAGYLLVVGLCVQLAQWDPDVGMIGALALFVPATAVFLVIAAWKTRGGWRWRWGGED